ncbi:hypothetical protein [Novipirellula sp.]|uniref:hypothetical protein n=1 Tax=Novipirellula sp. TaxID=2795430 RepID=UPI0035665E4D
MMTKTYANRPSRNVGALEFDQVYALLQSGNDRGNGVRGFDVLLKWTGSRTPVDRMVLTASGAYQARSETSPTLREFSMS